MGRKKKREAPDAGDIIAEYTKEIKTLTKFIRRGHGFSCLCHPCHKARSRLTGHLHLVEKYIQSLIKAEESE